MFCCIFLVNASGWSLSIVVVWHQYSLLDFYQVLAIIPLFQLGRSVEMAISPCDKAMVSRGVRESDDGHDAVRGDG